MEGDGYTIVGLRIVVAFFFVRDASEVGIGGCIREDLKGPFESLTGLLPALQEDQRSAEVVVAPVVTGHEVNDALKPGRCLLEASTPQVQTAQAPVGPEIIGLEGDGYTIVGLRIVGSVEPHVGESTAAVGLSVG